VAALRIERAADAAAVSAAASLFDERAKPDAVARFLAEPTHHMLIAYEAGEAAGFVTGAR
jgi:hypothetical protein